MQTLLDVVSVETTAGHKLLLAFENGERRLFDMTPFLDRKPFLELKAMNRFALASVDYGTVVWPGGIDIAPETLYDLSVPLSHP